VCVCVCVHVRVRMRVWMYARVRMYVTVGGLMGSPENGCSFRLIKKHSRWDCVRVCVCARERESKRESVRVCVRFGV